MEREQVSFHMGLKRSLLSFDEIFNLYYPLSVLFAEKLLGNRMDAEEIVQELFIKFWEKQNFKDVSGSIKSFLFKSIFNACIDFQRKASTKRNHNTQPVEDKSASEDFKDLVLEQEIENAINAAINELPEKRREIFLLSREKGMSYAEIARELSLSAKTVETQMSRSLKQLKEKLSDYIPLLFI
ncbi:RNA polymerase sigma-70 factor [Marinilabiliaceae bacterium JC017]|nr:RNA polymerase sigma-70 factor [Marinilabiliaceae bacterium JC017]